MTSSLNLVFFLCVMYFLGSYSASLEQFGVVSPKTKLVTIRKNKIGHDPGFLFGTVVPNVDQFSWNANYENAIKTVHKQNIERLDMDIWRMPESELFEQTHDQTDGVVSAVLELALFCDKDFAAIFKQDLQEIQNYLAIYYWDVAMKFKSLPSSKISIHISTIVTILDYESQPFIEVARSSDGSVAMIKVIKPFAQWISGNTDNLPKFDMAMLITGTRINDGIAGVAYSVGSACAREDSFEHSGTSVIGDSGSFSSVVAAAHEIGHLIGAHHDRQPECSNDKDFVMAPVQSTSEKKYFFSSCSDMQIGNFLRSENSSCLRRIDEPSPLEIAFENVRTVPTIEKQCRRTNIELQDTLYDIWGNNLCVVAYCIWRDHTNSSILYDTFLQPVDNTPCANKKLIGHCHRGKCLPAATSLKNAASGLCLMSNSSFEKSDEPILERCKKENNPLAKIFILEAETGKQIAASYTMNDAAEVGEKCLTLSQSQPRKLTWEKCETEDLSKYWQLWIVSEVENANRHFVVAHGETMEYLGVDEGRVFLTSNCDTGNKIYQWKFTE